MNYMRMHVDTFKTLNMAHHVGSLKIDSCGQYIVVFNSSLMPDHHFSVILMVALTI